MKLTFPELVEHAGLRPFQIMLVTVVMLVLMIDGIDIQLLSLVAPVIIEEWGIDRASFGPALAAALVGMSLGAFAGGWLGDRIGRLRALLLSTVLFGLATAAASLSHDVWTMSALRVLSGIGFGAAGPNSLALVSEWLPTRHRSQVVGLLSIGTPAGGMLGAWIVMVMLPDYGWKGTFIACGAATMVLAVVMVFILRESPAYLLARGKTEEARRAARPLLDPGIEVVATQASAGADGKPVEQIGLFDRRLMRLNIGAGLSFFFAALISYAFLAWAPVMLTDAGFTLQEALGTIFAFNLGSVTAALAAGVLVGIFGSKRMLIVCCTVLLLAILALGVVLAGDIGPLRLTALTACIALSGASAGATLTTLYAMMVGAYPLSCRGAGLGFGFMLGRTGGIVLSLVGGYLLNLGAGSAWPFLAVLAFGAIIAGSGAIISDIHVPRRERRSKMGRGAEPAIAR